MLSAARRASVGAARPAHILVVAVAVALAALTASPVVAAEPTTYQGHVYHANGTAPTADKPQSKLWHNDGSWWAIMLSQAGTVNIFELRSDHTWRDTGTVVDERVKSTGDALWVGGKLYVASRTGGSGGSIRVYRYSYSAGTRSYSRDTGFPVPAGGAGGTESVTIDRDSLGRLWISFTRGSAVWVAHSRTSDLDWTAPFRIPGVDTSVAADDISAVISLGDKIGVMWSDQASDTFRFAVHEDVDSDEVWTSEQPLSGPGTADDHLNLKSLLADDDGRVHAAVKTSLDASSSSPEVVVLSRSSSGQWSSAVTATVADRLTRPQLALDETNKRLFVLQSTENGGTVYVKSAPLTDIRFGSGPGAPFIAWPGAAVNNVSTSKQPVSAATGLVAIAADSGTDRYYHAEMALGVADGGGSGGDGGSATDNVAVTATADSYVVSTSPSTNYGTRSTVNIDASPATVAYLKFDLSPYAGRTVQDARLQVRPTASASKGKQTVKLVGNDSWTETGLTYASRPAVGTALGSLGPTSLNTTYSVPLNVSAVTAELGQDLSLAIDSGSTDGVDLGSRETSYPPTLVLTLGG